MLATVPAMTAQMALVSASVKLHLLVGTARHCVRVGVYALAMASAYKPPGYALVHATLLVLAAAFRALLTHRVSSAQAMVSVTKDRTAQVPADASLAAMGQTVPRPCVPMSVPE